MSAAPLRLKSRRPVRCTTILGIVLVPLTVAGILLWGLWNSTERLENVTAAVVNDDEAVELDGQTVPLGRVLAGELIAGDADDNFTWVLTDESDAAAGLDDGSYAAVVTIPESFSADATSLSGDAADARQARIDVTTSDQGRLLDAALSNIVTTTATSVLNQQLGEQFVDGVYVGFNELGDGIGDAADGATQLADGTSELADGTSELADGTSELASGAGELASGTAELSGGASQLASGAGELSSGASELATGASQLADGQQQLAEGVDAYVDGAGDLSDVYAQLSAGAIEAVTTLKQLSGAAAGLEQPLTDVGTGLGGIQESLVAFAGSGTLEDSGKIGELYVECLGSGATQAFCDQMSGALGEHAASIRGGLETAGGGMERVQKVMSGLGSGSGSGEDPSKQLDTLIAGLGDFGDGLAQFAEQGAELADGAQQSADGATQLADGTSQLAGGASQLASGTTELATGTSQLATGATQLADGTTELADGTSELADGTTELADGAGSLATGLGEAADGIPSTSGAERANLSEVATTPVTADGGSDELFNSSGVPLFAGIALWAGALAAFLLLSPLWRRTVDAARGVGYITAKSALPAIGLGALQGALAGVVLPIALGYDLAQGARFFGLALLVGVAFSLLVQGLSALLGGFGRFIAFALLVVAFAVGIVSTVPAGLAAVGDASPIGASLAGFQAIATGSGSAGGSAVVLALWGLAGAALTALAVMRARRAARP